MTLKQLYLLNSAWDADTVLTVYVKSSIRMSHLMGCSFYELPEKVMNANVVCFANASIIVRCEDV